MVALLRLVTIYLPKSYKRGFIIAFLLLLLSGIAEMISLASILPFLTILGGNNGHEVNNFFILNMLPSIFKPLSKNIYFLTGLFAFSTAFAAVIRLSSVWCNSFFAAKVGSYLSNYMFKGHINKDYESHVNQNINKIILVLTQHINGTVRALFYLLQFFSGIIISFFIIGYLIYINPILSTISLLIFGLYYLIVANIFKLKISENSKSIANFAQLQMKLVRESLGNIRDIIINEDISYYSEIYKKNDKSMRYKQATNHVIIFFPRYSLEAIAIISISLLGVLFNKRDIGNIAMIGSIAFGAQRLLPALQSIYSAWGMLKNFSADIFEVRNSIGNINLNSNFHKNSDYFRSFRDFKLITIRDIQYKYKVNSNYIFKGCNLSIKRGETVGFIGKTGSGKSTLVDIIMGLLNPLKGEIIIDDYVINKSNRDESLISWRKCISHVPQEVFLRNDTVYKNIVDHGFKLSKKNREKLLLALETSQVDEFINDLDNGLETLVGDRGVKLSGGQKQRIGVARALLKEKPILVLDESTSALDENIQKIMLESIKLNYPNLTILMITHRLNNLVYCDKVFEINKSIIKELDLNNKNELKENYEN